MRLLTIKAHDDAPHIRCTLSVHYVVAAPAYAAISYMWGAPDAPRMIVVNGLRVSVRENCWYALSQMSFHGLHAYYWLDALCINQDDLKKKSAQVAMMGSIYERANRVVACVGAHADDSQYLVDRISKLDQSDLFMARSIPGAAAVARHVTRHIEETLDAQYRRFTTALWHFCQRPYWNRLWIVQELFLGAQVMLVCGEHTLLEAHLAVLAEATLEPLTQPAAPEDYVHCVDNPDDSSLGVGSSFRTISHMMSERKQQKSFKLSLSDALAQFSMSECANTLDRIYALLQIVDWPNDKAAPVPDYAKSPLSFAMEMLGYIASLAATSDKFDSLAVNALHLLQTLAMTTRILQSLSG